MNAGFHKMPMAQYLADPAPEPSLSASIAHLISTRSSLHAWTAHPRLNPAYKSETNSILDAGTVAHSILLEGGTDRLVVVQADDWRTKAAKEQRNDAWTRGLIPILVGKLETVNLMVEAAKKYVAQSELAGVFKAGDPELTMLWQEGAAWCRARPDWLTQDLSVMLDYKTTAANAEPNAFVRQIITMGYDYSAGLYLRGARALGANPAWVFLVQENEPPYACSLVGLSEPMLDLAARKVENAIDLWKHATKTGKWSGYPSRICYVEPPEYAVRQIDEMLEIAGQG